VINALGIGLISPDMRMEVSNAYHLKDIPVPAKQAMDDNTLLTCIFLH
jgi:hypothetical protein